MIGPPRLDSALDGVARELFGGGALRESKEFGIRGEAKPDELLDGEARIERLAGQQVVAHVLFRAYYAVLNLLREEPAEKQSAEGDERKQNKYRGAQTAIAVAERAYKVSDGAEDCEDRQGREKEVKWRNEFRVFRVALLFHRLSSLFQYLIDYRGNQS